MPNSPVSNCGKFRTSGKYTPDRCYNRMRRKYWEYIIPIGNQIVQFFCDLWKIIRPIGKYTPEFLMGSIFSIGALNSQQVSILWKI